MISENKANSGSRCASRGEKKDMALKTRATRVAVFWEPAG